MGLFISCEGVEKMRQKDALAQLQNVKNIILEKHSKPQLTNEIFDVIFEMLSIDYKSISPGGKRLKVFNKYMLSVLEQALENGGYKNYMVDLINVFNDPIISKYLCNAFGNKSDDMLSIIDRLENRLFAWQGLEGCEWRRLEDMKKILQ